MELIERNRLVEENMIIVQRIVSALMRDGQEPNIEQDDLLQEGYLELIRTVDAFPRSKVRSLRAAIAKRVFSRLLRFRRKEECGGVTDAPLGFQCVSLDAILADLEGERDAESL